MHNCLVWTGCDPLIGLFLHVLQQANPPKPNMNVYLMYNMLSMVE